jgi:hypothetical protein
MSLQSEQRSLRFVLHGFAPTDALDEHVRFTDDQIDAITKTFLGTDRFVCSMPSS